MVAYQYR